MTDTRNSIQKVQESMAKVEDAAHESGDVGIMVLAVRDDAGTALSGTTGDYIPLTTDATGQLRVSGKLIANSGVDIGDVDVTSLPAVERRAIPSIAADNNAPADNTAAVVTYASGGGQTKHYLHDIFWAYDSDLTVVGTIKVEDVSGTTVFGPLPITKSGPGFLHFDPPIVSSAVATAMIVTLATGGATVQGVLSCRHEVK